MIDDAKIARLWNALTTMFNVNAQSIGIGELDNGQEYAAVSLEPVTDPKVISKLPTTFEGDAVQYKVAPAKVVAQEEEAFANPPRGQPGQQGYCPK